MTTANAVAASRPLKEHNAIEAATFTVALREPPSVDSMAAIRAALDTFAAELPGQQAQQQSHTGIFIAMGSGLPPFGDAVRFVAQPNGTHSWRVQCNGPVLQVACFDYTRFADVWPRALRYLSAMLKAAGPTAQVVEVSHHYVDKFLYPEGMELADYNMAELFLPQTPYLTAQSWHSGLLWHVFQGWFVNHGEPRRVLHQLNLSNTELTPTEIATVIEHRCTQQWHQLHISSAQALVDVSSGGNCPLDTIVRELHIAHKTLLKQLLQSAKLQQIGMVN